VEPGADLDQRAHAPADLQFPGRRREDPGEELQKRRLAGAVRPDDPERLARMHVEVDVAQRPDLARAGALAPQQRLLEGAVL
jgi:hypothetical protein